MFLRNLTPILSSALLFNAIPSLGLPMSMGQSENEQLTLRPSLFPTSSFESQEAFYPLKETLQEAGQQSDYLSFFQITRHGLWLQSELN